jgi:hypothetical protein
VVKGKERKRKSRGGNISTFYSAKMDITDLGRQDSALGHKVQLKQGKALLRLAKTRTEEHKAAAIKAMPKHD